MVMPTDTVLPDGELADGEWVDKTPVTTGEPAEPAVDVMTNFKAAARALRDAEAAQREVMRPVLERYRAALHALNEHVAPAHPGK
jgi:hypothetical protein